jgi:hypothetical protein
MRKGRADEREDVPGARTRHLSPAQPCPPARCRGALRRASAAPMDTRPARARDYDLVRHETHLRNRAQVERYLPDILGRALARIWIDPQFRDRFAADPVGTLASYDVYLPDNIEIEFVTEGTRARRSWSMNVSSAACRASVCSICNSSSRLPDDPPRPPCRLPLPLRRGAGSCARMIPCTPLSPHRPWVRISPPRWPSCARAARPKAHNILLSLARAARPRLSSTLLCSIPKGSACLRTRARRSIGHGARASRASPANALIQRLAEAATRPICGPSLSPASPPISNRGSRPVTAARCWNAIRLLQELLPKPDLAAAYAWQALSAALGTPNAARRAMPR